VPVQLKHLVNMLLRDVTMIKEFVPVNASLEYQKLSPFVSDAEKIIIELISEEFYDELDAYVDSLEPQDPPAEPTHNAYYDALLILLRHSISFISFHFGFDMLNTVFSNQGFHRIENADGSKKALFQRQEENLKRTFKVQGYNKLELALAYMENNKEEFATWVASDAYTITKSYFINSSNEFSDIYNISNSRLVFLKLKNAQVLAEDFDIKPLIGIDYYDSLKAQILSGTISDEDAMFLIILKKAVAYCSIARGGYSLIAELNEFGFYQFMSESNELNFRIESAASEKMIGSILAYAEKIGKSYLRSCESFLKKNITDYPLYANSTAYDDTYSVYDLKGTDKIGII